MLSLDHNLIRERLREAMGVTRAAEISRATGVPRSTISLYLKRDGNPMSVDFVAKACAYLGVSCHWLITGDGPMRAGQADLSAVDFDTIEAAYLAARTRRERETCAQEVQKMLAERLADAGVAATGADVGAGQEADGASLPVDSVVASAQRGASPGPMILDVEQLPPDWEGHYLPIIARIAAGLHLDSAQPHPAGIATQYVQYAGAPAKAFAVRIAGQSMEPIYHDGDLAIIDPAVTVAQGLCCIITKTHNERTARLKHLRLAGGQAHLESLNPDYKPITLPRRDLVAAYGIWKHLQL
jgi:phage repressor protein C with HTH and peptisase S24 domain